VSPDRDRLGSATPSHPPSRNPSRHPSPQRHPGGGVKGEKVPKNRTADKPPREFWGYLISHDHPTQPTPLFRRLLGAIADYVVSRNSLSLFLLLFLCSLFFCFPRFSASLSLP